MELDEVTRELYDGAPEDFVGVRKARVAQARAAGNRDLAKQIAALRRPTRSAWIVNLLSYQAADELGALLDLGAALADAQQRLSGKDLRELSRQRNAAISGLVRRGGQLAEVRGHRPSEGTLREVTDTLQAALSDPEVADAVRHGRLAQPQSYGGFGPELAFAPGPQPKVDHDKADHERVDHDAVDRDEPSAEDLAEIEHQRRLDELAAAQQSLDRLEVQLNRIQEQVRRAIKAADHRAERVADLRDQLERAEREANRATAERDRLVAERDEVLFAKDAAEQQVSDALSRLAGD